MISHYDWKNGTQICPTCGWTGVGNEAEIGETFDEGADYHCPSCEYRFGFIAYPLLTESLTDPRAPDSDRKFAEVALQGSGRAPSHQPAEQSNISVSGQRVFEDADYLLLKAPWLLGITHPFFYPFYVHLKSRNTLIKVTGKEKRFLLAILGEMARLGLNSQQIKSSAVFHDFCEAVPTRNSVRWQIFFNHSTAKELAHTYASAEQSI